LGVHKGEQKVSFVVIYDDVERYCAYSARTGDVLFDNALHICIFRSEQGLVKRKRDAVRFDACLYPFE
jgi:hypothetical protein